MTPNDLTTAAYRISEARDLLDGLIALMEASKDAPAVVGAYMLAPLLRPIRNLIDEASGEIEAQIH